jgi:hypothetical protein
VGKSDLTAKHKKRQVSHKRVGRVYQWYYRAIHKKQAGFRLKSTYVSWLTPKSKIVLTTLFKLRKRILFILLKKGLRSLQFQKYEIIRLKILNMYSKHFSKR